MAENQQESVKDVGRQAKVAPQQAKAVAVAVRTYFAKKDSLGREFLDLFSSLFSFDPSTRRMAALFFISLTGVILISVVCVKQSWDARKLRIVLEAQQRAIRLKELMRREADGAKLRASTVGLGGFILELKDVPNRKQGPSDLNMASVEIVLLCDEAETRTYIESNIVQVRNQLTNVFTSMDRDEFLSREGKRKIKSILIRKLNEWLPHGKVEDLYFSKLIIT